jgi:hypothetical protein
LNNIVFYLRGVFVNQIIPTIPEVEYRNIENVIKNFDKVSKIPFLEYRNLLHNIQLKNLNHISSNFIVNKPFKCWSDLSVIDQLEDLKDDDVLIPLDDDDWLSPAIKEFNFLPYQLNTWNCVSIGNDSYSEPFLFYHLEHEEEPQLNYSNLMSNCYSIPGWYIKSLIKDNKIYNLKNILQNHTRVRREIHSLSCIFTNLTNLRMGIYVKHLANISSLLEIHKTSDEIYIHNFLQKMNIKYSEVILPEFLEWAKPLYEGLSLLNKKVLNLS